MTQNQSTCEVEEQSPPCQLESTQVWFAGVITSPLEPNSYINPVAPSGYLIAEEAAKYVVPSPTLKPHLRMQVYNQQYWWRLLKALHENFPFLTRLFGYTAFNEILAIPFLLRYPPNHWSLSTLGERLPQWLEEEYHASDKPLVLNSAKLDCAFISSFVADQRPFLDIALLTEGNAEANILSKTFYLQPHIHLFKWDYDLPTFREAFLEKDVDYWTENDFPDLPKGKAYHYIIYRSYKNDVHWKEISPGEYLLLSAFKKGSTLDAACEVLEQQEDALVQEATQNLQSWLQDWVKRGWFTLERSS